MSDEDAEKAVEQFRSIRGVGKEMWEATGLTPDEYVRQEREEWDESEKKRGWNRRRFYPWYNQTLL